MHCKHRHVLHLFTSGVEMPENNSINLWQKAGRGCRGREKHAHTYTHKRGNGRKKRYIRRRKQGSWWKTCHGSHPAADGGRVNTRAAKTLSCRTSTVGTGLRALSFGGCGEIIVLCVCVCAVHTADYKLCCDVNILTLEYIWLCPWVWRVGPIWDESPGCLCVTLHKSRCE